MMTLKSLILLPLVLSYDTHIAKDIALTADAAYILGSWDLQPLFESIKALDNYIEIGLSATTYDDVHHFNYNVQIAKRAKRDLVQAIGELHRALGSDFELQTNSSKSNRRTNRASVLSWVSDVFDYTFGFVGHSKFETYKQNIISNFQILSLKNEHLQMIVSTHKSAMQEVQFQLNDMTKTLNTVVTKVNMIFGTLTWSIRIEAGLAAINRACMMLTASKHRADGSYISRFVINEQILGLYLLQLSDTSKYLHPIFGSSEVSSYYKARCSVSSFNGSHFVTLVRIPLVSRASMFKVVESPAMTGHVTLRNEIGSSFIHYTDYIACLGSVLPYPFPSWCNVRPCIAKSESIRCLAKNSTSIIIKAKTPINLDITCPSNVFSVDIQNISIIDLPHHCEIDSTHLFIPKVQSSRLTEITPTIRSFDKFDTTETPGVIVKFLDQAFTKRLNLPEPQSENLPELQMIPVSIAGLVLASISAIGLLLGGTLAYFKLKALKTRPNIVGHRLEDLVNAIA